MAIQKRTKTRSFIVSVLGCEVSEIIAERLSYNSAKVKPVHVGSSINFSGLKQANLANFGYA